MPTLSEGMISQQLFKFSRSSPNDTKRQTPEKYTQEIERKGCLEITRHPDNYGHKILLNGNVEVLSLPGGRKAISRKWVYETRHIPRGRIEKYKGGRGARHFQKRAGIDLNKIYSAIVEPTSYLILSPIAAVLGWKASSTIDGAPEDEERMAREDRVSLPINKSRKAITGPYDASSLPVSSRTSNAPNNGKKAICEDKTRPPIIKGSKPRISAPDAASRLPVSNTTPPAPKDDKPTARDDEPRPSTKKGRKAKSKAKTRAKPNTRTKPSAPSKKIPVPIAGPTPHGSKPSGFASVNPIDYLGLEGVGDVLFLVVVVLLLGVMGLVGWVGSARKHW
ncbi:MAG: hypothetical protein Q9218_006848 [Villophora microphyllina]